MYHCFFNQSPSGERFGYLQFSTITNETVIKNYVRAFMWVKIWANIIAQERKYWISTRWYAKCVLSSLRNSQTIFQSDCTMLLSPEQCMRNAATLHAPQYLVLSLVFILAILMDMQ